MDLFENILNTIVGDLFAQSMISIERPEGSYIPLKYGRLDEDDERNINSYFDNFILI